MHMTSVRKRLIDEAVRVNPVLPVHIWRAPAGAATDVLIVAHHSAYTAMHEHCAASLPNETGGFLLGRVACDDRDGTWHLEIEETMPVEPVTQNPTHFAFTWRDVDHVRSYREEQGKALLGWYHTHPNLGIFLSETDLERTHRVLFAEPFQIALVYDPVRGRAGYFFWEGAQKIDASEAAWREFDIAVTRDAIPEGVPETLVRRAPPAVRADAAPDVEPVAPDTPIEQAPPAAAVASGEVHATQTHVRDLSPPAASAVGAPATAIEEMERRSPDPAGHAAAQRRVIDPIASPLASPLDVRLDRAVPPRGQSAAAVWMVVSGILLLVGVLIGYLWFAPPGG
jgi:proteasome lid subunit RPN8/RPN11